MPMQLRSDPGQHTSTCVCSVVVIAIVVIAIVVLGGCDSFCDDCLWVLD